MKKVKKIISLLLSVMIVVCSLSLPAAADAADAAKEGSTVKITTVKTSYKYTYNGSTRYFYIHKTSNGKYAYCLQWSKEYDSSTMKSKKLTSTAAWKDLSSTAKTGITRATVVGFPNYSYGVSAQAAAVATQMVINEYEKGWRTSSNASSYTSGLNNKVLYNAAKSYSDLWTAYKGIIRSIANYNVRPSFNGKSLTLKYDSDSKTYKGSLTDSNNILSSYTISSNNSAVKTSVSGNKITVTSSKKVSGAKLTFTKKGTTTATQKYGSAVGLYYSDKTQTLVYGTVPVSPVTASATVTTENDAELKLVKTCSESGCKKHIEGITFKITCSDLAYSKTVKTDKNGNIYVTGLHPGKYTVTEVVPSDCNTPEITYNGKTAKAKSVIVTLTAGTTKTIKVKNTPVVGSLEIKKINNSKEPLQGAEFTLYTSNNKVYKKLVTDKNGYASLKNIPSGTYKLVETKAPEGYVLDSFTKTFTVNNSKTSFSYTFKNTNTYESPKGIVYLFKYDNDTNLTKSGAEFEIYAAEDIYERDDDITAKYPKDTKLPYRIFTDDNGFGQSEPLLAGKYYAVEVKAPDGYILDTTPHYFEIKGDESVDYTPNVSVNLGDAEKYIKHETAEPEQPSEPDSDESEDPTEPKEPTKPSEPEKIEYSYGSVIVDVSNSASSANKVWGATVSCYYVDDEGNDILVGTGITDEKGKITFENVAIGEQYKFVQKANFNSNFDVNENEQLVKLTEDNTSQTVSIKNYISSNAVKVNSVTQVNVYDDPITVIINKKDETTLKGLPGANIYVYDKDGNYYDSGITDDNGELKLTGIPAGEYTFQERSAPDGFVRNSTVFAITIDEYGKVTGDTTILNTPTEVVLHKSDVTTSKGVPGAKIEIYDKDGKTVFEDITGKDGTITVKGLPAGTYTFKEVVAPEGYILNTAIFTFTLNEDGTIDGDNTVSDEPTSVTITKADQETMEPLQGVEFEFFDEDGKSIGTYKTDENGEINLQYLSCGKSYSYVERSALKGYVLDSTKHTFTINDDGSVTGDIVITNTHIYGSVQVNKTDANGNALSGAKFKIYKDVNNNKKYDKDVDVFVGDLAETDKGIYKYNSLVYGGYFLNEHTAPSGYSADNNFYYFEITKNNKTVIVSNDDSGNFINKKIPTTSTKSPKTGANEFIVFLSIILMAAGFLILLKMKLHKNKIDNSPKRI